MDTSIFSNKELIPGDQALSEKLGKTCDLWNSIRDYVQKKAPDSVEEWKYSGKKFGWSFRINDKKRVLIYLRPREAYFKAATAEFNATKISRLDFGELRKVREEINFQWSLRDRKDLDPSRPFETAYQSVNRYIELVWPGR